MEMEFSKIEKIVGAFVAGVLLLLLLSVVMIGRGKDWFETYVTYYTTFNETYNLQVNAPVKLFRADIGKVDDITLENNRVLVKLAIREKFTPRIREDAVAVVESPTLIGSEYIAILPGSADAPPIAENGAIPSREKRSIDDLLTEFEVEKTAKMVVTAIQDISKVSENLSDPNGPLLATLDNLERISRDMAKLTADLEAGKGPMGLMLKSEDLMQRIVDNIEQMGDILANIDEAAAMTPATVQLVNDNLAAFKETGGAIHAGIQEARTILQAIEASAGDLQTTMENIKAGSRQVPEITTTFKEGILEIRQGVEEVNRVVDAMQKSVLIRGNLPPDPVPQVTDAGARP